MTNNRRARFAKISQKYMEEAGQELGFFRSMEEIKALSAMNRLIKKWKEDKTQEQNHESNKKDH